MDDQSRVFVRKLLIWYKKAARELPWRDTRNPYAILVSEFMLQQTQVSRVLEYFPRFMARFSGSLLCLREGSTGGGHERETGAESGIRECEIRNSESGIVAAGVHARSEERQASVEIQSGDDGVRSTGLHGTGTEVPRVSRQARLSLYSSDKLPNSYPRARAS